MQIDKITRVTPSTTAWDAGRSQSTPPTSSSSALSKSAEPLDSSTQIQKLTSTSQTAIITASYSATVGGKNYAESIQESGGTYIASVSNPPAVSASGSSVQSAENNLDIVLDTLA